MPRRGWSSLPVPDGWLVRCHSGASTSFRAVVPPIAKERPNGSSRLRTGIGSVESLRGGIEKIFVHSCRCEARGAVVGGAGHCPNLSAGELQRSAVGSHRLSSVMETLIDNAEFSARLNHRFYPM